MRSQYFDTKRRRGSAAANLLLGLIALMALGFGYFWLTSGDEVADLVALPATPLAALESQAGSGRMVRVRARLVSNPALIFADGAALALQRVQVAQDEPSGGSIAYDSTTPDVAWASDGKTAIAVETTDFDPYFVDPSLEVPIVTEGQLPPEFASRLLPVFDAMPAPKGATARLWNIDQGAAVTIIGVVEREDDAIMLKAPAGDQPFLISPLTPADLEQVVGEGSGVAWPGWLALVIGALSLLILLRKLTRRGSRVRRPAE